MTRRIGQMPDKQKPFRLLPSLESELLALAKGGDRDPATVARMQALQRSIERRESRVGPPIIFQPRDADPVDGHYQEGEVGEGEARAHIVEDDEEVGHCSVERVLRLYGFPAHEAAEIATLLRPTQANAALTMAAGLVAVIMDALKGTPSGEAVRHALGLSIAGPSLRKTALEIGVSVQRLSKLAKTFAARFPRVKSAPNGRAKNWLGDESPPDSQHEWLPTGPAALRIGASANLLGRLHRAGLVQGTEGGTGKRTWFKAGDLDAVAQDRALSGLCWRDYLSAKGQGVAGCGGGSFPRALSAGSPGAFFTSELRKSKSLNY